MDKKFLGGLAALALVASTGAYAQDAADQQLSQQLDVTPVELAPATAIASLAAVQSAPRRMSTEASMRAITVEAVAMTLAFTAVAVGIVHGRSDSAPTHATPTHQQ